MITLLLNSRCIGYFLGLSFLLMQINGSSQQTKVFEKINTRTFDPTTLQWYDVPAKKWDEALPVGNGRLGAMIFGKTGEERIHFNEETYWSKSGF